jgi:uracil-DNA glycosylase family 4
VRAYAIAFAGLTFLAGTSTARAECKPAAIPQGDPQLVSSLSERLHASGIDTQPSADCPAVRVLVAMRGQQVHLRVTDAYERLGEREVQDVATAAAIIESWTLQEIREDIGDCTRCKLHTLGRRQIVFGTGSDKADLMFVGEAPGADEDAQGVPFVGRAGQLLTKMIEAMGFGRDDVYIANVIKCRPPGNRNPEPDEVESCEPFLFRQIATVQPKVIVALGAYAAKALLLHAGHGCRAERPGAAQGHLHRLVPHRFSHFFTGRTFPNSCIADQKV